MVTNKRALQILAAAMRAANPDDWARFGEHFGADVAALAAEVLRLRGTGAQLLAELAAAEVDAAAACQVALGDMIAHGEEPRVVVADGNLVGAQS